MTDDQIKLMINRFLRWRLPVDFSPDCGIKFDADAAKKLNPRNARYEPVGTNLFSHTQAEAMVRYMMEDLEVPETIKLTAAEVQSKHDRQRWAEGLISQLPRDHDGRNSWLMNYGIGSEAIEKREKRGLRWIEETRACEISIGKSTNQEAVARTRELLDLPSQEWLDRQVAAEPDGMELEAGRSHPEALSPKAEGNAREALERIANGDVQPAECEAFASETLAFLARPPGVAPKDPRMLELAALERTGLDAQLPEGYQWGSDAMESFAFGKERATSAIMAELRKVGEDRIERATRALVKRRAELDPRFSDGEPSFEDIELALAALGA